VQHALQILQAVEADTKVVGIDEVQFFGMELVSVVQVLASRGLRVICAGLDQDYQGKPFEPMPQLLAIAELITKELAICVVCGNPANRSQRLTYSEERVVVGAAGAYEARCRKCHVATAVAATPGKEIDLFNT
jgi:thymidine kinase